MLLVYTQRRSPFALTLRSGLATSVLGPAQVPSALIGYAAVMDEMFPYKGNQIFILGCTTLLKRPLVIKGH